MFGARAPHAQCGASDTGDIADGMYVLPYEDPNPACDS
jgi:hypothetical protein